MVNKEQAEAWLLEESHAFAIFNSEEQLVFIVSAQGQGKNKQDDNKPFVRIDDITPCLKIIEVSKTVGHFRKLRIILVN